MKIGERLRNLRLASDLTQEELAERADLTKGFISVLERDQTSVSVDSLLQILRVLNVKVTDFFHDIEDEKIVYSSSDRTSLEDTGAEHFELLIPGGANRTMESALVRLEPDQRLYTVKPYRGESFGYVLQGILTINYGSDKHTAKSGDSFYFSGEKEHTLENTGRRPVEFLWITSPPVF